MAAIVGELRGLQRGAPDDVAGALAHLATAFQQAEGALEHPSKQGRTELADAADVLSADGTKISNYVTSQCK